ncbi:MAG: MFS transporter [Burkholderiales bacterium]|nr:MFS transporter [Burkholderiales bacterium]
MHPTIAQPSAFVGILILGLGAALGPFDFAVNVAFPAISVAFKLGTGGIRWVAIVYVLTYGCLLLACGRLGDAVGHRRVFQAGLGIAAVAFALCALAPTYAWLLAARVMQGVAVALILASGPALATGLVDEARRTWALGVYASVAGAAGVVAPLIGGASIALMGWSGVYWFRVPIALFTLLCLHRVPHQQRTAAIRFNAGGALLLAAAIALALIAPTLLDVHLAAAAMAVLAGLALAIAAARQRRAGERPLIARAILTDPRFYLPNVGSVTIHLTSFSIPLTAPYYFARVAGFDAPGIGAILAVWAVGALATSLAAARLVAALGVRRAAFAAGILMTAGLAMMTLWTVEPRPGLMIATLVIHGLGIGLFQVAYTDLVVAALPRQDRGVAGGLSNLTRTVGLVIGAAAFSAILREVEADQAAAGASPIDAFQAGFHAVFLAAAAICGAFFLVTAWVRGVWFERPAR